MRRSVTVLGVLFLAAGVACGDDSGGGNDTELNGCPVGPRDGAALLEWLSTGEYQSWTSENAVHPTAGPHANEGSDVVRVFVNTCLEESLTAGNSSHPVGSMAVKELYGDGTTIRGYSATIKTGPDTEGLGEDWYFFTNFDGEEVTATNGASACVNCHMAGSDYVQTGFPFMF